MKSSRNCARPEFQETLIIVVSASVMESDREKSLVAGADAFLPKPVNANDLLHILEARLGVTWISTEAAPAEEVPVDPLIAPPAGDLEMLYNLALRGDMRRIQEKADSLAQTDENYKSFAAKLSRLAEDFETKAVLELIKHSMEEHQ
ncbi:MAG: hypothetical protein JW730_10745 [Anaerolineales bacterium]|nr:hypothetical protein [Anaerolineales bacterium]